MIHEARGLDYFLLPSLFSDCLAPGGYDSLIRERDDWFTANSKFGRSYVDHMRKMQQAGIELLPDLGIGSDQDEYLPESPDIRMSMKLGAGRRAVAVDQVTRAGGMSEKSKVEAWSPVWRGGQHLSTLIGDIIVPKAGIVAFPKGLDIRRPRLVDEGFDTDEDEEEDKKRKRRRRRSSPLVVKVELESDSQSARLATTRTIVVPSSDRMSSDQDGVRISSTPAEEVREAKLETEVDMTEVTVEDVKPILDPRLHRRPRLSVDKEHLRLLSRLAQEVDDL